MIWITRYKYPILLCLIFFVVGAVSIALAHPTQSVPLLGHIHNDYVTMTALLSYVLGFLGANSIVILSSAVIIGRKLERMDNHSDSIDALTVETARVSANQVKILEAIARIEGAHDKH